MAAMRIELKANLIAKGLAEAPKYKAILTYLGDVENNKDVGPSLDNMKIRNPKSHMDKKLGINVERTKVGTKAKADVKTKIDEKNNTGLMEVPKDKAIPIDLGDAEKTTITTTNLGPRRPRLKRPGTNKEELHRREERRGKNTQ